MIYHCQYLLEMYTNIKRICISDSTSQFCKLCTNLNIKHISTRTFCSLLSKREVIALQLTCFKRRWNNIHKEYLEMKNSEQFLAYRTTQVYFFLIIICIYSFYFIETLKNLKKSFFTNNL